MVNVFSLHDFLNNIFLSQAYFIIGIQYVMHIIYKTLLSNVYVISMSSAQLQAIS